MIGYKIVNKKNKDLTINVELYDNILMHITLEQAKTLESVARLGSFSKAAKELHKVHSAVMYALSSLESVTELKILDRSGYRVALTPTGERMLEYCQRLLEAEKAALAFCESLKSGLDPFLKVVFDGFFPITDLMKSVKALSRKAPMTRISLYCEFLGGVQERFFREKADLMISLIAPESKTAKIADLNPILSLLVAHKDHPLARMKLSFRDLEKETFLTVRGSDQRLQMSTSELEKGSIFHLSDFHAKKEALMQALGYGWMPAYLIEKELRQKSLVILKLGENLNRHTFRPAVYATNAKISQSAQFFLKNLLA